MARPKGFEPLTHALEGLNNINQYKQNYFIKQRLAKLIILQLYVNNYM